MNHLIESINKINITSLPLIGRGYTASAYLYKYTKKEQEKELIIKLYNTDKNSVNFRRKQNSDSDIIRNYNLINNIIKNNICPNFLYCYYIPNIYIKLKYILLERAAGTLKNYFDANYNTSLSYPLLESIIIQLLIGIMCMQKILFMEHRDLKLDNIFYKNIEPDTIINYNINNTVFTPLKI